MAAAAAAARRRFSSRPGSKRRRVMEKGPKMDTLIKTVSKRLAADVRKATRRYGVSNPKTQEHMLRRRFRSDERMAFSRALDAAGFDPKNPRDKMLRAQIQKIGQKMADLSYDRYFDVDKRRDPETHSAMERVLQQIVVIIGTEKGPEAVEEFDRVHRDKMGSIQIAHEEAAREDKRKMRY